LKRNLGKRYVRKFPIDLVSCLFNWQEFSVTVFLYDNSQQCGWLIFIHYQRYRFWFIRLCYKKTGFDSRGISHVFSKRKPSARPNTLHPKFMSCQPLAGRRRDLQVIVVNIQVIMRVNIQAISSSKIWTLMKIHVSRTSTTIQVTKQQESWTSEWSLTFRGNSQLNHQGNTTQNSLI
jgi:hypothetical protein